MLRFGFTNVGIKRGRRTSPASLPLAAASP